MWSEIKRKSFHFCGIIYVIGLIHIPRPAYVAILTMALIVVLAFEMARLKIPTVGRWVEKIFGSLLRSGEQGRPSGVFWMLAGVNVTVVLVESVPLAAASLLYLILGDGVASLAGMRLGGPHWPRSQKRVSGSLACFLVCLLIGVVLLQPQFGWGAVVVGALVATVVEFGVVPMDDNFTIPVISGLVLKLFGA